MFYQTAAYLTQPRRPETWLIEHIMPAGGFCNVYGKPKAGKSFLALGAACAISSGLRHWMGIPVYTHGPVMYLQIDTPRSVWADRVERAVKNGYDLSNIWFADLESGTPVPLNILSDGPWLAEQIAAVNPVMIVLDTLRELHGGDENDSGVMKNVISAVQVACRPCAMMLISHKKKEGQMHSDDLMQDNRGSSYVAGRMDCVVSCRTLPKNDNAGFMAYQGRTANFTEIKMVRTDEDGIWRQDDEENAIMTDIALVMSTMPNASQRDQAKTLADMWGCEPEAARKRLKRKAGMFRGKLAR